MPFLDAPNRNQLIQRIAALARVGKLQRSLGRLLRPRVEVRRRAVAGTYDLEVDLAMGVLQRHLFLAPESYEPETQALLRRLLEPGMTAMDIGANVGFFSIFMADRVGPTGRVHAFEPYPPNFRLLRDNLQRNRLGWVRPHPVALSDRRGTAVLNLNPVNDGGHSLGDLTDNPDLQGWDRARLKAEVETDTLDDVVQREAIGTPHLIKIDVEGAETLVFAGGRQTLSAEDAPVIVCEVGDAAQRQFGRTERELRGQLYAHGYRSYVIGRRLRELGPGTPVAGLPNVLFAKQLPARLRPLVR